MNKQEQRIIQAARKVLDNWLYGDINADVSGDFNELESALKDYGTQSAMDFDWQSFRAEAAKDILCQVITLEEVTVALTKARVSKERAVSIAISYADELIRQLKEREKAISYADELIRQLKEREKK